jgi:septal ring factor EnvC (AmiA/AmiB activator)
MDETPSMESYLIGRKPESETPVRSPKGSIVPEWLKTTLLVILVVMVGYLLNDSYNYQKLNQAQLAAVDQRIQALENQTKAGIESLSNLKGEISETQQAVGTTRAEIKKTAQQIQQEGARTKEELSQAIASKADQHTVQAIRQETDSKIGQVSTEVGGVKTEVGTVKTDLATTKRDLEGTQRQLIDVKDTLTAAVAKNASELEALRRKGERDYHEFTIAKKNDPTKVEDIRLILRKTDTKKGKYNVDIIVDDSKLEKKDRTINEPIQFLVGRNRVRYEMVLNWVQKDSAGGYLSIPKDKAIAAERATP